MQTDIIPKAVKRPGKVIKIANLDLKQKLIFNEYKIKLLVNLRQENSTHLHYKSAQRTFNFVKNRITSCFYAPSTNKNKITTGSKFCVAHLKNTLLSNLVFLIVIQKKNFRIPSIEKSRTWCGYWWCLKSQLQLKRFSPIISHRRFCKV